MSRLLLSLTLFVVSVLSLCVCPSFAVVNDTCVTYPFPQSCIGYTLPSSQITQNINMLCGGMMGTMGGCTVNTLCTNTASLKYDKYCNSFSVYKDICTDMAMMGCENYTSMCQNGTVVEQCAMAYLDIPNSMEALPSLIQSICTEMPMPSCKQCMSMSKTLALNLNLPNLEPRFEEELGQMMNCDMLTVYSNLCLSMPSMSECAAWSAMCTQIPTWPLCTIKGNDALAPVPMVMYFHTSILDYILLESWVPRTAWQYVIALLGVFLAQILHEMLKLIRKKVETHWQRTNYGTPINDETVGFGGSNKEIIPPFSFTIDLTRAFLQAFEVAWGLLMMLIAMSFNVGLFFAIFVGSFIGTLIIGRYVYSFNYKPPVSSCH